MTLAPISSPALDRTLRQVDDFQRTGRLRPAWLKRKVEAVYSGNPWEMLEGLQDELDALNAAEYKPYLVKG